MDLIPSIRPPPMPCPPLPERPNEKQKWDKLEKVVKQWKFEEKYAISQKEKEEYLLALDDLKAELDHTQKLYEIKVHILELNICSLEEKLHYEKKILLPLFTGLQILIISNENYIE